MEESSANKSLIAYGFFNEFELVAVQQMMMLYVVVLCAHRWMLGTFIVLVAQHLIATNKNMN